MSDLTSERVFSTFQQQIAKSYHRLLKAENSADRYNQANNLAEVLIKTAASILHGLYRLGDRVREVDLVLSEDFRRPSVASYLLLLKEICRSTPSSAGPLWTFVSALRDERGDTSALAAFTNASRSFRLGVDVTKKKSSIQFFFDEYVLFRHKRAHGAPVPEHYDRFTSVLQPALIATMTRLESVFTEPLLTIRRVELDPETRSAKYTALLLSGLAELPEDFSIPIGTEFLATHAMYLRLAHEFFEVSPLLRLCENEVGFLNEFKPDALCEYLIHHTGGLHRQSVNVGLSEFLGLPPDLAVSDIRSRNGISHNLPRRPFATFVGRQEEIENLQRALARRTFPIVTLWGWGGCGKTALAIQLGYELLQQPEDSDVRFDYVVWLSAKKTELTADGIRTLRSPSVTASTVLNEIVRVLGLSDLISDQAPIERRVRELRSLCDTSDRILVIVDNFETFDEDPTASWETFKDLAGGVQFLVTSRYKRGEAEQPVHLSGLPEDEAIALLLQEAANRDAPPLLQAGEPLLRRVVTECDCLPLAIKTVVGWVKKGLGVKQSLEGFHAVEGEGIHEFCFEESYELLGDNERFLAFFLCQSDEALTLEEAHLASGLSKKAVENCIDELFNLSLVERTRGSEGVYVVQMTNLPRDYFRKRFPVAPEFKDKVQHALAELERLQSETDAPADYLPPDVLGAGKAARIAYRYGLLRDFANADKWWSAASEQTPSNASVWKRRGYYEGMIKGDLESGLTSLRKALMLEPNDEHSWFVRGVMERKIGRLDSALTSFLKCRELGTVPFLATCNLGLTYFELGRRAFRLNDRTAAARFNQFTIEHLENAWAPDGFATRDRHNAMVAVKLAKALIFSGRTADAIRVVSRALRNKPGDWELRRLDESLRDRADN